MILKRQDLTNISQSFKGHGRRRRSTDRNSTEYTRFKENIAYSVIMPGEENSGPMSIKQSYEQCKNVVGVTGVLAALLALSTIIVSKNLVKNMFSFSIQNIDIF